MKNIQTRCVHAGTRFDADTKGVNTPVYTSTSFAYLDADEAIYPRYFNIANAEALGRKIAALEMTESGLIFSSGMAAISSVLFAFLQQGDHAIFQTGLYGGTFHFVTSELSRFGMSWDIASENTPAAFEKLIRPNTKLLYIETPSNPLLKVTDIRASSTLAQAHGLVSVIDNTFATPVNQLPHTLGMDIVLHSATKYLGGHGDICAGAIACSKDHFLKIRGMARSLGGSLNAQTLYLLERSIKTLAIRIRQQNDTAMRIARWLSEQKSILQVFYPGLPDHPEHELAAKQMSGFGGMLSFELKDRDPESFQRSLKMIRPSVSLGGVDSIICAPVMTSHRHLSPEERAKEGISDGLLRLSVGIENAEDLIADLEQAM